jgi:hypothetical protein
MEDCNVREKRVLPFGDSIVGAMLVSACMWWWTVFLSGRAWVWMVGSSKHCRAFSYELTPLP